MNLNLNFNQLGGGLCSLCGAPGTNKINCPLNPTAKKPDAAKHPNAGTGAAPTPAPVKKSKAKAAAPPKKKAATKPVVASAEAIIENYFDRANKDLIHDIGYTATWTPYILHFTDSELDEFASAIVEIATKNGPVDIDLSLGEIVQYITHYGTDADVSSPAMKRIRQKMLTSLANKGFNSDRQLISKQEVLVKLIRPFAITCFPEYRPRKDPLLWRFGNACKNYSMMDRLKKLSEDEYEPGDNMVGRIMNKIPASLLKDAKDYLFNMLLTRESIEEVYIINANEAPERFEFRKLSQEDDRFVDKFIPASMDWIESSEEVLNAVEYCDGELAIRQDLNIILHTILELQMIDTPRAKKNLQVLMSFVKKNAGILGLIMMFSLYQAAIYINKQKEAQRKLDAKAKAQ